MNEEQYFSDYRIFTEDEIAEISAQGITLKNGLYINFTECTQAWANVNSVDGSKCVGDRDISDASFTFYTLPKPTVIKFIKKGRLSELLSKNNASRRFHDLQFLLVKLGYQTFDLT